MKNWKQDCPNFSFEELVAMYINDCMQYLKAKLQFKEPDLTKDEFEQTQNQELIYYGLRELKDLCMRISGKEPLNWKD